MFENWKTYILDDVLEALIDYRGKTPKKTTSGIPLVTAKIVKESRIQEPHEFIANEDYNSWMTRGFPKVGDVVLTTEAPLGEVAQIRDSNIALAQRIVTLRGKNGVLDNGYLKYFLLSSKGQSRLEQRQSGTTVFGIKQSELRKVEIECPPYPEQRAIASILSSLDDKIELNLQMNKTLEEMAIALYKHWFLDFGPFKDGEFVISELGEIPKGWEVKRLDRICEKIYSGGTPRTNVPEYWNGDLPWLSSGETRNKYIISTDKYITNLGFQKSSTRMAYKYDIVIASAGQGKTRGQTSLLLIDTTINQSVLCLRADKSIIHPITLFYDLNNRYDYFRHISDSYSTRGSLTTKLIGEQIKLALPSIEVQAAFHNQVAGFISYQENILRENQTLLTLRNTLLPKLISGEIRVKEAAKAMAEVL